MLSATLLAFYVACAAAGRSLSLSSSRRSRPTVGWALNSLPVRGGALALDDDYDISESEIEYDSEEAEEDELSEDELSNLEDDSDEEAESAPSSSASGPPVKLSITTALQSSLVDQHIEFMASRKRTVESLKQAVSKTMRGRPPLSCIQLKYHGRTLDEEETIDDLLQEMDEDDEEEGDDGEDEDTIKMSLTCDLIPPIDAKFAIELREKIMKKSTKEILEAYCLNMAGAVYSQELQSKESDSFESNLLADDVEHDDEEEQPPPYSNARENHSMNIRKKAALFQKQFEGTLPPEILQLMEEEYERVKTVTSADGDSGGAFGLVPHGSRSPARSGRKGRSLKGGATMNVKRTLQRNLNVNWADTTRNSLLFLFFGYFGGRNSFSRTFLLLMSPLCFFIQTRPVKVAMKVLFYAIGEPPSIFLSLLPAPQQAIMSLDYGSVMKGLYGEKVLEGEEWLELERSEETLSFDDGDGQGDLDMEFDDEYDDEYGYDSDEDI